MNAVCLRFYTLEKRKLHGMLVQDWLLQNGGVAAERLLLVAPKKVDASYQGQSRAILTLN